MSWKTDLVRCTSAPLHLYNRGVDGMTIFHSEYDYQYCINLLEESIPKYQVKLHLFVLMPNHYHVSCTQQEAYEVSEFSHDVWWRYAKFYNRKYSRRGPLFTSRFVPRLVEGDAGLLRLSHYIHRNPSSAGLVKLPQEWPFSSLRCYLDGESTSLISRVPIWNIVGGHAQYEKFMHDYDPSDPDSIVKFMKKVRGS